MWVRISLEQICLEQICLEQISVTQTARNPTGASLQSLHCGSYIRDSIIPVMLLNELNQAFNNKPLYNFITFKQRQPCSIGYFYQIHFPVAIVPNV